MRRSHALYSVILAGVIFLGHAAIPAIAQTCETSLPRTVTFISAETKLGEAYWPCSAEPFIVEGSGCTDSGLRYTKYKGSGVIYFFAVGDLTYTVDSFAAGSEEEPCANSHYHYHGVYSFENLHVGTDDYHANEFFFYHPGVPDYQFSYGTGSDRLTTTETSWTNELYNYPIEYIHETGTLSGAVSRRIREPAIVDTEPETLDAYALPDDEWQTCSITGGIVTCPGKYRVTLFYKKYPYPYGSHLSSTPTEGKIVETKEFEGDMPPDGYEVKFDLPTSTCFISVFDRIEYVPVQGCGGSSEPGTETSSNSSVKSAVSLGKLADGTSAGLLYLHRPIVMPSVFTPADLVYLPGENEAAVRVIKDSNFALRQLLTAQALVNITPLQVGTVDSGYKIDFYTPSSPLPVPDSGTGLYPLPTGVDPFATILYENPDAPTVLNADATRLRITRQRNGVTSKVSLFTNESGGALSLSEGDGLRRIVKSITVSGADTTEREDRYSPASATVPDEVSWSVTRQFAFGTRVVEESRGTSAARAWTTFTYDETSTSSSYGLLIRRESSDGSWARYEYDSERRLSATVTPLGDAAYTETSAANLVRVERHYSEPTSSAYGSGQLVTTLTITGGVETERRHRFEREEHQTITVGDLETSTRHTIDVRAAHPAAALAWDDSANEFTHLYRILYGEHAGEPALEISPDGQIVLTRYRDDYATQERTTERWAGVPDTTPTATSTPTDIIAGTRTVTLARIDGALLSSETRDVASETTPSNGLLLASTIYDDHDLAGRPLIIGHLDGSEETHEYSPCCGQLSTVTRHGVTTTYGYDALGRLESERVEAGSETLSEIQTTYDSAGRVLTRTRVATVGTATQLLERNTYDNAGRLLSTSTPGSLATDTTLTRTTTYDLAYNSSNGRTTRTTTLPDGATLIEVTDRAGRRLSTTGTAARPVAFTYGTATLAAAADWGCLTTTGFTTTTETKLDAGGAPTDETLTVYTDPRGRAIKTVYADGATARTFYDNAGRVVKQIDPDGVTTLQTHETYTFGERTTLALDLASTPAGTRSGTITADGYDRITRTTTTIATRTDGSVTTPVRRTTTEVWPTDATDTATVINTSETSLDGLKTWQTTYGQTTITELVYGTGGTHTQTTTHPDGSSLTRTFTADRLTDELRQDGASPPITLSEVAYAYDLYGRLETQTLTGTGDTTHAYYADDRVYTTTTPDPDTSLSGPGYDPQITTYAYDAAGRPTLVTHPDATETHTTYWPTGQLKRTWGSRVYPSEYTYDPQGRVKTLTTWKDFGTTPAGAAVTTWDYDEQRGWLTAKTYEGAAPGPAYTYWPSGRLKTRTWARGDVTTYTYDNAGDLWTIVYTGTSTAPTVTRIYDRLGRLKTTTDAAGLLTHTYEDGRLDDETYTTASGLDNLLAGLGLARGLDGQKRPATLAATGMTGVSYGYDDASRLSTLTQDSRVATLGYKAAVGTLESVTTTVGGTERATLTRITDKLGRITRIATTTGATLHAGRDYTHDDANRRTRVVHEDTRRWAYAYDALGQVTSAEKKLSDDTTVLPGHAFGFTYDDIGNRETATTNGRTANYVSDALNRYLARGTPLALDVRGSAATTAVVLVNDTPTTRTGADFYREVPAHPLKENLLKIQAVDTTANVVATENRSAHVGTVPENYTYDLDGNLLQDGLWNYTWDAENRLLSAELRADIATSNRHRLEFAYDHQSRRIRKVVKTWNSTTSAWTTDADLRFLYDGWNLIAEYDGLNSNALVRSHTWGLDLSGTPQGVGGVGGLFWTTVAATSETYAPGYDANGNIVVYIDLSDGSVAGRRDYGAFGEPVMTTGIADALHFGFSTKYEDSETGALYYGFRYYNPSTGRWLSRDPIQERGGLNLYGIVGNNPINAIDRLGLEIILKEFKVVGKSWINKIDNLGTLKSVTGRDMSGSLDGFRRFFENFTNVVDVPPATDANDSRYRLYSERIFKVECDTTSGSLKVTSEKLIYGGGAERIFGTVSFETTLGAGKISETLSADGKTFNFSWTVIGRPHWSVDVPAVRLGDTLAPSIGGVQYRPQNNRWIYHTVSGTIRYSGGELEINADLSGSSFPSHRSFINGSINETLMQGPLSDLWNLPDISGIIK